MTLNGSSIQTLTSSFEAIGSVSNLISISSSGIENAILFADNSDIRFCLDYLDVQNVSVPGQTGFLSGDNSNINANSIGWIELDCDDALFASFEIEFPCALGEVKFIDTSTGFPTEWRWNFGNLQFPEENNSSQQNPFHNFRFEGIYDITFNVKNSQFDQTIDRSVEIIQYESGLGVPNINIDGTRLTSSVIAPNYQWYRNNSPIPGANERIYEIANPGTYIVTVADENCLFKSEATVVTSIEKEFKSNLFKIYPNPSTGVLNFEMDNKYKGKVQVMVYDLIGNDIYNFNFSKNTDFMEKQIALRNLSNGIYHIVLDVGGKQFIEKLIISH